MPKTRVPVLLGHNDFGLYLVATLEDIPSVTHLDSYLPGTSTTGDIEKPDSEDGVD